MFRRPLVLVVALMLPVLAAAAGPREIDLPSFAALQKKASESVDITIGSLPLRFIGCFLDDEDADSAAAKKLIAGLKLVHVRHFRFESDFDYPVTEVEAFRSQLSGPGWSRLVQVHDGRRNKNVDVYAAMDHDKVTGLTIIASEAREFTVVNVVGEIDVKQIALLQKGLGLPGVRIDLVSRPPI